MNSWIVYDDNTYRMTTILDQIAEKISAIPQTGTDGHSGNWHRVPRDIIDDALRIIDEYRRGLKREEDDLK